MPPCPRGRSTRPHPPQRWPAHLDTRLLSVDQVGLGLHSSVAPPSAQAAALPAATAAFSTTNLTLTLTDRPPDKSLIRDSRAGVAAGPVMSGISATACSTRPVAPMSSSGGGTAITSPAPPTAQVAAQAAAASRGPSTRADTGTPLRAV